jgi:hypothetical protein
LISMDGGWERTAACSCLAPDEMSRRKTGRREQACWLLCAARVKHEWEKSISGAPCISSRKKKSRGREVLLVVNLGERSLARGRARVSHPEISNFRM